MIIIIYVDLFVHLSACDLHHKLVSGGQFKRDADKLPRDADELARVQVTQLVRVVGNSRADCHAQGASISWLARHEIRTGSPGRGLGASSDRGASVAIGSSQTFAARRTRPFCTLEFKVAPDEFVGRSVDL